MAAPTNTYCDYANTLTVYGSDYKGATFTDGAYTHATKTLVKAGAFAASKANHRIYISSGTHIVAGIYTIATASDANTIVLATSCSDGNDSTDVGMVQHDGTTSLPWNTIQGALDLITRDATNGDQINVKASTAQVLAASLALTTYGTPAEGVPLVLRGYTTTAGDRGIGEINCNGVTMFAATGTITYLADLLIHNFGNANGINIDAPMLHCEVHKGASTPSGRTLVICPMLVDCYIHDAGSTGVGFAPLAAGQSAFYCTFKDCPSAITTIGYSCAFRCIFIDCAAPITGGGDYNASVECNYYSSTANTGTAIGLGLGSAARTRHLIINNIIEGYSGSGGKGISNAGGGDIGILGYNAFYNNETPESLGDVILDLGGDATLAASPFTDAASGDFSLITSVAGAIDGAYPGAWYGPASTTDHADMGAVQNGAGAAGGGLLRNPGMEGNINA